MHVHRGWNVRSFLLAAAVMVTVPMTANAGMKLPVEGGTVTSGVGWRIDPFGSGKMLYHRGIDIAVPVGTAVHATGAGRVVFVGAHGGYGNTVIVENRFGDRTLYGHNSAIVARQGEEVEAGKVIALSGSSGRSTGPHVHYELLPASNVVTELAKAGDVKENIPAGTDARYTKEQILEETMDSLLQKIKTLSVVTGGVEQGG